MRGWRRSSVLVDVGRHVLYTYLEICYNKTGEVFAVKKTYRVKMDFVSMKKQYEEHVEKCKKIAEEVNQWGKKANPQLKFLIPQR